ncbi:MAG: ArsR/SmtB family transcription factor [Salibacteraceae bacterium]
MLVNSLSPQQFERAAAMLKAIAHPIRMSIVSLLEGESKLSVTEIYQELKLEQAVASHHLGILKSKGIVESVRQGKSCFYYLKYPNISGVVRCIGQCCNKLSQID